MTIERSRFAFDIGTNSIGWAVYRLDRQGRPCELEDCGVRLFSDGRNPKDGQSLAAMRRVPRAARRRRDRFLQRRAWLMTLLVRRGLMPADEAERKALEKLDVYAIRGRALDARLEPFEIGRALFHLNQRRGYKSNRIADARAADDKDKGKIASAGERLEAELGDRTLGQYYAALQTGPVRQRKGVRARINGEGAKAFYEIYPQRDMLEDEFDRIWAAQAAHHPALLTEQARTAIRQAIFHQRPLKAPVIGRCTFFPTETRLADAHPVAQRFRIYQELANLEIEEGLERPRRLTLAERDLLAAPLLEGTDLTFGARGPHGLRKILDLPGAAKINLEEGGRDRLKGDASAARLGGKKGALKRLWSGLDEDTRGEIIERLLTGDDMDALKGWLVADIGATPEEAEDAARFVPPQGHLRVGPTFARGLVEAMKAGDPETGRVLRLYEAQLRAFPNFKPDTQTYETLPDYRMALKRHTLGGTGHPADKKEKQLGRIPNPTVHIGLNQLRQVMNALIDRHGPPDEVVLELARDLKQNLEQKKKTQEDIKKNEAANRRRAEQLLELDPPLEATPYRLRLMRLWEELGPPLSRLCTYTGKPISLRQLMSDEIEVEHILPWSRTLDDSMANKTVTFRDVNRGKRNKAPCESDWSDVPGGYEAIQQRADGLTNPNKRWRFKPGAMERYEKEERGFLDRQLNETRHLSKLAREYIAPLVNHEEGVNNVWVVTGQLTAMLRARWGLNFSNVKDRNNHRHHAIDAATIGVIDRGLLNELARRAGAREGDDDLNAITKDVPEPPGFTAASRNFRDNVREKVQAVIVSHKAEHGTGGALHEDTAYGLVDPARGEDGNLVYRKAIDSLTGKEVGRIRDLNLRARLTAWLGERGVKDGDKTAWPAALREFRDTHKIRRVRLLKKEEGVVVLKDKTGKPYKALVPGENHHMDIVEGLDGVWRGYAATVFEANQKSLEPRWKAELPGARLIMRVHKGDMVEVEDKDGARRVKRIAQIWQKENLLCLAGHDEGGELAKRHKDDDDHFRWDFANIGKLRARNCRLLRGAVI